jgi:putative spermidine/putrescine transport system permease protein
VDRAVQPRGAAIAIAAAEIVARPSSRRRTGRDGWLAAPLTLFFLLFFVMPLALLAGVSFYTSPEMTAMGPAQYAKFAGDSFNWSVLGATLWLGVKTVAVTALIGYPLALVFTAAGRRLQPILLFVIILPLLTSVVVRTFAWIVILGRDGLVNRVLLDLGLIAAPVRMLHTEWGLVVALSQIEMPLMLLPLISLMSRLDPNLKDASAALGAGRWRTLFRVILPLSLPGLLAGCLLVFSSSVTAFVSQTFIGGGRMVLLPFYIWQQATTLFNWPFAAAVSIVLLLSVLTVVVVLNTLGRRSRAYAHG